MHHRDRRPVIYQLVVRLFGNTNLGTTLDGTIIENGCGRFADIDERALKAIRELGITHIWLTGALRQATLTDYSSLGMPADHPDVVKGRAGSFYAIRDYYDVSPDYAVDPERRLDEFVELIERIHGAGMRVLLDLVANHVARGYASVVAPETDFGRDDDQTQFCSPQNDFFYLADPPGQALRLEKPKHWNPPGVLFDGRFEPESGKPGSTPRATGNNVTSATLSADDWYETVKLEYGFNFVTGETRFDPIPRVWTKIDAIIAYWQAKGVDGFRCDFAHYIPDAAWAYLIAAAKKRDPQVLMLAEAYENHSGLLAAGFDALYDFETYNAMKRIYVGRASPADLSRRFGDVSDEARERYVEYLENHDERRMASPVVTMGGEGDSGFGSMNAIRQLGPLSYLYNGGPILIYNGQEVGESGLGAKGFSADDGRTSIFDYASMPEIVKWANDGQYNGGGLSLEQQRLRVYYSDLLTLAQNSAVRGSRYWGLSDRISVEGGAARQLIAFARFEASRLPLLVVVGNFAFGRSVDATVRLPAELLTAAGMQSEGRYRATRVLADAGHDDTDFGAHSGQDLTMRGLSLNLSNQTAQVISIDEEAGDMSSRRRAP